MNTLYRFFATDGALLYVGRTRNPARRFEKHSHEKPWREAVSRIGMEQHPTHELLCRTENAAIKAEKPRHNIRGNSSSASTVKAERDYLETEDCDGLVGRWFHSWEPLTGEAKEEYATIKGGKKVGWQGQVIDRDDGIYIVQTYSWWDGAEYTQQIVTVEDMRLWTFYGSAIEMQIALGCPESDPDRCGNPVTHYFDHRSSGMGVHWLCGSCVKRYPGYRDAPEIVWRNGKPTLP